MTDNRQAKTERRLLAMLAETSVHAGTGAQLGAVDLPVQRERHTEWPTIYGTGLKGVFRDHAQGAGWSDGDMRAVFGPETEKADGREAVRHAGALALSDARLLLFPVRTIGPAFAWVTCPLALARLRRDAAEAGIEGMPAVSESPSDTHAVVPGSWKGGGVLLEEFSYEATVSRELGQLGGWIAERFLPASPPYDYWKELVRTALVLVTDADFRDFVRHATEVVTRVRLTAAKTVERGALWTEENLPSDTLLYSFVVAWPPANGASTDIDGAAAVMQRVAGLVRARPVVQVGGKETVGRGFVAVRLTGGRDAQ